MASPNMETFDSFFRRADLDKDGRISGMEAVTFFQGSNLPKHILAQIWTLADQNRTGFLGRAEFYNMLRLVTVAQSGRELRPDIVKAALYSPAAAKIPAPQINPVASPASQLNPVAAPSPQMGAVVPGSSQIVGIRGPLAVPSAGMNQQFLPTSDNQFVRPPQATSAASRPLQGNNAAQVQPGAGVMVDPRLPNSTSSNMSTNLLGGHPAGATALGHNRGVSPVSLDGLGGLAPSGAVPLLQPRPPASSGLSSSVSLIQDGFGGLAPPVSTSLISSSAQTPSAPTPAKPQDSGPPSLQPTVKDSPSGNGFMSDLSFGGDVFSAAPSRPRQDFATQNASASSAPTSSAAVPVDMGPQASAKQEQVDPFQPLALPTGSSHIQRPPLPVKQNHLVAVQGSSAVTASAVSVGAVGSASDQTQPLWPKFSPSDIQKYTKVFVEVDKDRDGKITGQEARNLFLSWRLPREVLKQVWDLSDQDNDSMLSLREFCTALYLMERYREGRSLPPGLPDSIKFDDTLLRAAGQPTAAYGWQPNPGFPQQGFVGARAGAANVGLRLPAQVPIPPQADSAPQPAPKKSRMPVLEKHLLNQLSKEEQNTLNSKFQQVEDADKKVEELEKEILDAKEKVEFYRTKMQELVLYKSKCDNRLNEITERASSDKREFELLAKKYQEKYMQVGDVASKLTLEEATFREIQERKMELYNAIVKMVQSETADGLLQARADQIQSDLGELVKGLNERCKKYGLRTKPTSLVELPFGWQPGIQEGAADWDDEWDKFEDEGFSIVKDLTVDIENILATPRPARVWNDKSSSDDTFGSASLSNVGNKTQKSSPSNDDCKPDKSSSLEVDTEMEKPGINRDHVTEGRSEDEFARSPPRSPHRRKSLRSPSQEYSLDTHFGKDFAVDASPRFKESQSDHDTAESTASVAKFDHDGAESTASMAKFDHEAVDSTTSLVKFDGSTWGANFDMSDDFDSVWGFGTVKTKESDHEQNGQYSFFDSDDFGINPIRTDPLDADAYFQKKEKSSFFADSISNTPLFNSNSSPRFSETDNSFDGFGRFDSFSMNDSGLFTPHETLARFDSIRSARDSDHGRGFLSFDDADPFGSTGPFKFSESQTSRRGPDNWSAF